MIPNSLHTDSKSTITFLWVSKMSKTLCCLEIYHGGNKISLVVYLLPIGNNDGWVSGWVTYGVCFVCVSFTHNTEPLSCFIVSTQTRNEGKKFFSHTIVLLESVKLSQGIQQI